MVEPTKVVEEKWMEPNPTGIACFVGSNTGYRCTLAPNHEGNHKAGSSIQPNGLCRVYCEWPQDAVEKS